MEKAAGQLFAKTFIKKRLSRLEELSSTWSAAWFGYQAGQAPSATEQDQKEKAVLQAEAQLIKECPHIFAISYYRPVWKTVRDDIEI